MPDVRLLTDFRGRKAGEIVEMDNDMLSEAYGAGAVKKVYPVPFPGLVRSKAQIGGKAAKKTAKKTAAKGAARRPVGKAGSVAQPKANRPAFGDGPAE